MNNYNLVYVGPKEKELQLSHVANGEAIAKEIEVAYMGGMKEILKLVERPENIQNVDKETASTLVEKTKLLRKEIEGLFEGPTSEANAIHKSWTEPRKRILKAIDDFSKPAGKRLAVITIAEENERQRIIKEAEEKKRRDREAAQKLIDEAKRKADELRQEKLELEKIESKKGKTEGETETPRVPGFAAFKKKQEIEASEQEVSEELSKAEAKIQEIVITPIETPEPVQKKTESEVMTMEVVYGHKFEVTDEIQVLRAILSGALPLELDGKCIVSRFSEKVIKDYVLSKPETMKAFGVIEKNGNISNVAGLRITTSSETITRMKPTK